MVAQNMIELLVGLKALPVATKVTNAFTVQPTVLRHRFISVTTWFEKLSCEHIDLN